MGYRRKHHRAYGVIYDESTSTPTCERIGQGQSAAAATKLPDNLMVLQSLMRRCVINDAGVVQYYLDASDSTLKEDGNPSNLDGTDGQVMVEIAQGWLKYWYEGTEHHYLISKEQFAGAARLDAFYKNDEYVKNRYIGAYEGTLYDVSETAYVNGFQYLATTARLFTFTAADDKIQAVAGTSAALTHPFTRVEVGQKIAISNTGGVNDGTFTIATKGDDYVTTVEALADDADVQAVIETQKDWNNDVLSSVSGKAPINYGTRANFRTAGASRGVTGWRQQDYDLISAIQLLYLVEYASFYSQSMIGAGLTNFGSTNWSNWSDSNPIELTGNSNSDGNVTANLDNGGNTLGSYMSYRGIENFFGHVWKWVDGINMGGAASPADDNKVHVCNKDTDFADNTWTNYTDLGVVLAQANGYQVTLEQISRGFLPASVGGGSTTYITDYYYQSIGWRVAALGGSASDDGAYAGVACWSLHYSLGYRNRHVGGRLSF